MTLTAAEIWRKYNIPGVPASGPHQPVKAEIITQQTALEAIHAGSGLAYASLALLGGDLAHAANVTALVYNDGTNNGMYEKIGASASGSWTRVGDLPTGVVRITVTGGTANAIVATATETPLMPGSKLYLLTPNANNTAAVTISVNGAAAVSIKNALGSSLAANSLLDDSPVLLAWVVDHYQILVSVPVDATGVLNDALAAEAAAQAAQAAAEAAAAALGNQAQTFDTTTQLAASTTPSGVNAARVLGNLTIGDDGDAILKKVSTPAIIKPWNKPSNNAWFELMGTVGSLKFFGGKSSGSTANNSANNQALKDIAQWITERKEAGCATEMAFHPGVYDYDDSGFQLAQRGATLRSIGQPRLRYHGAGRAITFDGLAGTVLDGIGDGLRAFKMLGQLTVESVNTADDVIVVKSLHDSDLDLRCGGGNSTKAGLRLEFGVCSRIRYSVTGSTKWAGTDMPQFGVYVTDLQPPVAGGGGPNSFCTLFPTVEAVPYGVWCDKANGLRIQDGTIENCSNTGLTIARTSLLLTVRGVNFESNGSYGIYCVGNDCTFEGLLCDRINLANDGVAAAARNYIFGGTCETVLCDAGTAYNTIQTTFNATGSGALTDNGTFNRTKGSVNSAGGKFFVRDRIAPTVTASPYIFQNTTGDDLLAAVSGGTVSAIAIQPQASGPYIDTGQTAGTFALAPKDNLKITYSVAPTFNVWGV